MHQIGYTFLPCVLAGLSRAPQYLVWKSRDSEAGCILASNVDSVILPIDACGGDGALAFARGVNNKVHTKNIVVVTSFSFLPVAKNICIQFNLVLPQL